MNVLDRHLYTFVMKHDLDWEMKHPITTGKSKAVFLHILRLSFQSVKNLCPTQWEQLSVVTFSGIFKQNDWFEKCWTLVNSELGCVPQTELELTRKQMTEAGIPHRKEWHGSTLSVASSSSVGPMANTTDVLQPNGLLYSPYPPPPVWTFPRPLPGTSTSPTTREILVAKGGTVWARIGR